jgi:hypothetical protein
VFSEPALCCCSSLSSSSRAVEVEVWLSQCTLSMMCMVSLSVSSCVDLPSLYDILVQLLFNSDWDGNALA